MNEWREHFRNVSSIQINILDRSAYRIQQDTGHTQHTERNHYYIIQTGGYSRKHTQHSTQFI